MSEVVEIGALEEALSGVGHFALDLGLVLGVAVAGQVGDEAPMLGVFREASGEDGMQGIRAHHGGGEIVDDQVLGHAAEEAHAASRPAMTSASLCCCMGQTKQWREWHITMTMAHTALRLPVAGR